jgi:hypothetical protein
MATKAYIINSNQANYTDEEFSAVQTELYTEGVFDDNQSNDDLLVVENAPADMSVDINTGGVLISFTKGVITWKVVGKNNATINLAIAPNAGGTNRVDAIVAHLKQDEPNALKNNVFEVIRVAGSGATPLTDGAIDTAVGDTNWYRLADITVVPSATQILTANIADTRQPISIGLNQGGYMSKYIGDGASLFGILKNPLDSDLLVDTDSAYDIGTPLVKHANIYSDNFIGDNFIGDGSGLTNIGTALQKDYLTYGEDIYEDDALIICHDPYSDMRANNTATTTDADVNALNWFSQTFLTNGRTTGIDYVILQLQRVGTVAGNVNVSIYATAGGLPTGSALATASVLASSITTPSMAEYTFTFANQCPVNPNTLYAIVVSVPSGTPAAHIAWAYSNANPYADGEYCASTDGGVVWTNNPANDFYFKVYEGMIVGRAYKTNTFYTNRDLNLNRVFHTIFQYKGIALEDGVAGESKLVQFSGKNINLTNFTVGQEVYLDTALDASVAVQAGGATNQAIYGANWYSQTFTVGADTKALTRILIRLQKVLNPVGNIDISIYNTTAGLPSGSPLYTFSVLASTISTSATNYTYTFPNPLPVLPSGQYAIVISVPTGDASNYIRWIYNNVGAYTGGQYCSSANSGGTWTGNPTFDFWFEVWEDKTGRLTSTQPTDYIKVVGEMLDSSGLTLKKTLNRFKLTITDTLITAGSFTDYPKIVGFKVNRATVHATCVIAFSGAAGYFTGEMNNYYDQRGTHYAGLATLVNCILNGVVTYVYNAGVPVGVSGILRDFTKNGFTYRIQTSNPTYNGFASNTTILWLEGE